MYLLKVVDGSNESLYQPDEETGPILREGIPLLKSWKILNVNRDIALFRDRGISSTLIYTDDNQTHIMVAM